VTQECDKCASDEFNNKAGDSMCFKCIATPEYIPLQDDMVVWYKFDQEPAAWGPLLPGGPWFQRGQGPGHHNKGLLFESSVHKRHGWFIWNIHAKHPHNDRDTLNRQLFLQGDASFSGTSGHAAHLGGWWMGVDSTIIFFFRYDRHSNGGRRLLNMQVHNGISFAIIRSGETLIFRHEHGTWFETRGHGGFKEDLWYHLAWVQQGSRTRWAIYVNGKRVPMILNAPTQPFRTKPY